MDRTIGTRSRGVDFRSHGFAVDMKPLPDGSFSEEQLAGLLWDLRFEPDWRRQAEIEYAYYDNEQLTQETLRKMKAAGFPPIIINMIAPAIDAVSGFETITRSDPKIIPEREEFFEVAEGMNVEFKEALGESFFNDTCGMAFKCSAIIGIGWGTVIRNPDPFGYPHLTQLVPWREMYWDYRSRAHNILDDARFMARRKWFDADELIAHFPGHRATILRGMGGYPHGWLNDWEDITYDDVASQYAHTLNAEERFTLEADEYRQQTRGRVPLYEILYKVPRNVVTLRFRDKQVIEFNPENPLHLRAVQTNFAIVQKGVTQDWRQAWYTGDIRLADQPLRKNLPHYVPFVFFRRDSDGAVYGFVRRQKSPQEAINARHSRSVYNSSSNKWMIDDDAVDDPEGMRDELNRSDAMIIRKADRRNPNGVEPVDATEMNAATLQLLRESKEDIFGVTGLYPEFQGRNAAGSAQSGVALETKIEQTQQVLGLPMRNYKRAKHLMAELLRNNVVDEMQSFDNIPIEIGGEGGVARRTIVLNQRVPNGLIRTNDIVIARTKVAIGDVPESVTYQQQKFQQLTEIVKSMPEEMQGPLMHLVVRAAQLPESEEITDIMRQLTGFGPEPKDPQKRQQLAMQQEEQQKIEKMFQELEIRVQRAEAVLKESQAVKAAADAEKTSGADTQMTLAQTDLAQAQTRMTLAEIGQRSQELEIRETESEAKLLEAGARLEKEAAAAEKPDEPAKPAAKGKAKAGSKK